MLGDIREIRDKVGDVREILTRRMNETIERKKMREVSRGRVERTDIRSRLGGGLEKSAFKLS